MTFSSWIHLGIKSCLVCGSFQRENHDLCSICTDKLVQRVNYNKGQILIREHQLQLSFTSLFEWVPSESDHLSRLFLKVKGDKQKNIWAFLARHFFKACVISNEFKSRNQVFVIPCPSKTRSSDHAEQWARALAKEMRWVYLPCLQWKAPSLSKQRFKSRSERLNFQNEEHVKFTVKPCFISFFRSGRNARECFIFADDVITTGSTAAQAFISLGQPKNFMVVSLGRRAVAKNQSIW